MARFPVFQMIIVPGNGNSAYLNFSDEVDGFVQPVFVIPMNAFHRSNSNQDQFIMPGEINEDYVEFVLTWQNNLLVLKHESLEYEIAFSIGAPFDFDFPYINLFPFKYFSMKYSGAKKQLISKFDNEFILLYPLDLLIMDQLWFEKKACFVGYTPHFGKLDALNKLG